MDFAKDFTQIFILMLIINLFIWWGNHILAAISTHINKQK